ncbi:hypothetical protein [Desulfomicrobium baculatum]|nr:hypothetical protein [Desulfomicrobium baculatum]
MKSKMRCMFAFAFVFFLISCPTWAADSSTSWIGTGDTSWSNSMNWDNGVPVTGSRVVLSLPDANNGDYTVVYDVLGDDFPKLTDIIINGSTDFQPILQLQKGTDSSPLYFESASMLVGDTGKGSLVHEYGTVETQSLILGDDTDSVGRYAISGEFKLPDEIEAPAEWGPDQTDSFLGVLGNLLVGNAGDGAFSQQGGIVIVKDDLILGSTFTGEGSYTLANGVLWTGNTVVGGDGTGLFTQSGGLHLIGFDPFNLTPIESEEHTLVVNAGSYDMSDGRLLVSSEIIGNGGQFLQSDGEHHVYKNMVVGSASAGSITLSDQAKLVVESDILLGLNGGEGSVSLDNTASLRVNGNMLLGMREPGGSESGNGIVIQGSEQTSAEGGPSVSAGSVILGNDATTTGAYTLHSGTFTAGGVVVGQGGSGTFRQTGGVAAIRGNLELGAVFDSIGTYELSSGSLDVSGLEHIGGKGTATFTQTGGSNTAGSMTVGTGSNYSFQGGSLTVTDTINNYGLFQGAGEINVETFNNDGTLAPGNSPGTLSITGDFNQGSEGILAIELGGTQPSLFDTLNIMGEANLAGTLLIESWDNFMPKAGDSFTILTAQNLSGQFLIDSKITGINWIASYRDNKVSLTASSVPLPGAALLLAPVLLGLVGFRRKLAA